jgi:hypothetical protein
MHTPGFILIGGQAIEIERGRSHLGCLRARAGEWRDEFVLLEIEY